MAETTGTGRTLPRMLVVRIGWMTYYAGSQSRDPQPIGGGSYNYEEIGHEVCNFVDLDGKLHGYAEPPKSKGFNLKRIDPQASDNGLDDVLVIFVATKSGVGQVVVGWYCHAKVYRKSKKEKDVRRSFDGDFYSYYFETTTANAILLPPQTRTHLIPGGRGAIGQANVFYLYNNSGQRRNLLWLEQLVDFVEQYDGNNLLTITPLGPDIVAMTAAEELTETTGKGQGFLRTASIRKAIEARAMTVAETHFDKEKWELENHSATEPYDFLGKKNGEQLFIEVKGTQGGGSCIFLTPNEVKQARKNYPHTVLAIVTGIEVLESDGQVEARKGKLRLIQPWQPDEDALEPLVYKFYTNLESVS